VAQCFNIENTPGEPILIGDLLLFKENVNGLLLVSLGTYMAELNPYPKELLIGVKA